MNLCASQIRKKMRIFVPISFITKEPKTSTIWILNNEIFLVQKLISKSWKALKIFAELQRLKLTYRLNQRFHNNVFCEKMKFWQFCMCCQVSLYHGWCQDILNFRDVACSFFLVLKARQRTLFKICLSITIDARK